MTAPETHEAQDRLWATLPEEALPPLSDEWMAEIKRRSADFEAGRTHAISWETVRAEAIARLRGSPEASQGGS
jgi:putative addiction module component (TIGR02574 family)